MSKNLEELKQELINVLTEMDKIKPVQFHDVDCDNCVYNFSNVSVSEEDDRVYVEIAMWHDNLPSHLENPLKDGRGRVIPPEDVKYPKDTVEYEGETYKVSDIVESLPNSIRKMYDSDYACARANVEAYHKSVSF